MWQGSSYAVGCKKSFLDIRHISTKRATKRKMIRSFRTLARLALIGLGAVAPAPISINVAGAAFRGECPGSESGGNSESGGSGTSGDNTGSAVENGQGDGDERGEQSPPPRSSPAGVGWYVKQWEGVHFGCLPLWVTAYWVCVPWGVSRRRVNIFLGR